MKLVSPIDFNVDQWLWQGRAEWLAQVFYYFTYLGEAYVVAGLTVLASIYLWKKQTKIKAYSLLVSVAGGAGTVLLLKHFIARPRPAHGFYAESLASFPSAHATLAVAFYGLLFYFLISQVANKLHQKIYYCLAVLFILLLGFSRLYLGVHYLSDVVAGHLVGVVWLGIGVWIKNKLKSKNNELVTKCNQLK